MLLSQFIKGLIDISCRFIKGLINHLKRFIYLKRFINGLSNEDFIKVTKAAIVIDAIVVLAVLFALGWVLSRWNLDSSFDYVSSFLEIIIALDASCSFEMVQKWLDEKRDSYVKNHIISVRNITNPQITESLSNAVQPLHNAMQRIREEIEDVTIKSGLITAILVTILLVVGFTNCMKPYAVVAAAPILFFVSAVCVHYWFWTIVYERLQIGQKDMPDSNDDNNVVLEVVESTGPVSPEADAEH